VTPRPVYLDHHATTPVDPAVVGAMLPYLTEKFGNPSSRQHLFGQEAHAAVEEARAHVARLIGAETGDIVFTSGATESNNLAVRGVGRGAGSRGRHLVTTAIEHPAVLEPARSLEREGFEVTVVGVGPEGIVSADEIARALRPDTVLVSVMAANNEIGTVQPIAEIGRLCHEREILFHTDAVQAIGRVPVSVEAWGADLVSVSAHKMYGPKGVGALYVRRARRPRIRLQAQAEGGGQEKGLRSGTLNVPGIVGFGKAAELCKQEMAAEGERLGGLRDYLNQRLHANLDEIFINGSMEHRLPHNLNISFAYVEGESLLMGINDVAVSSGSACTSASLEPSYVLKALGAGDDLAHSSIRFGLGRFTTKEEVDYVADKLSSVVSRLRDMSPLYELAKEGVDLSTMQWQTEGH